MTIKTIKYSEVAKDLLEIYKRDSRIQLVDSFDELIELLQENPKDLIYKTEEDSE